MAPGQMTLKAKEWSQPTLGKMPGNQFNEDLQHFVEAVAAKELRETTNTREQCLLQLREWIKQNPDVENCLTGRL